MLEEPARKRFASTIAAHIPHPYYVIDDDSQKYDKKEILDIIWDHLRRNPNLRANLATSPRENYVEFRPLGGRNYLDRNPLEKIKKIVTGYKNFLKKNLEKKARKLVAKLMKPRQHEKLGEEYLNKILEFKEFLNRLILTRTFKHEVYMFFERILHSSSSEKELKNNVLKKIKELLGRKKWIDLTKLLIVLKLLKVWSDRYGYELISKVYLKHYIKILDKALARLGTKKEELQRRFIKSTKEEDIEWGGVYSGEMLLHFKSLTTCPDEEGIKTPPPRGSTRGPRLLSPLALMKKGLRPSGVGGTSRCRDSLSPLALMKKGLRPGHSPSTRRAPAALSPLALMKKGLRRGGGARGERHHPRPFHHLP